MSLACDSRVQLEEQTIQHLRERLEIRGIDLIGTKERVIFPFLTKVCSYFSFFDKSLYCLLGKHIASTNYKAFCFKNNWLRLCYSIILFVYSFYFFRDLL